MKKYLLWALLIIFLGSCSHREDIVNADFRNINSDGWVYGDTLCFDMPCDSSATSSGLLIAVRHSGSYRYANLWLEVTAPGVDGVCRDTMNIKLYDKYGRNLGHGTGVSFVRTDTVGHRIAPCGEVTVRHIMRVDTLDGIEQIGVLRF